MKISIIIPTFNHLEDCLKPCCESLIQNTSFDNPNREIEVVVVSNGCTDGTEEYIESLKFNQISFPQPIGYTKAINEGIKKATGDYLVLLNNDTIILNWKKDLWLDFLLQPFLDDSKCGITGPLKRFSEESKSEFLVFFCVMISRKTFDKLGYLDECFSPGGGEDIDYCAKAQRNGLKIVKIPNSGDFPIYHKAEKTVNEIQGWSDIFNRNMNVLRDRYDINWKLCNNYERAVIGKNDGIPPKETIRYQWARKNII